jgi:hypothetical protein
MGEKYERTITPAPEVLSATATVGFVLEQISSDLDRHESADADAHRDMWNGITKVDIKTAVQEKKMDRIYGGLALLAVLIALFVPLTYYAVKGVIVEELDKRFPDMVTKRYHAQKEQKEASASVTTVQESKDIPWSPFPSAQAGSN